jgi:aspartokinase
VKLEVWKFGGASLADGRAIAAAAEKICAHRGPLVVVASALAGVTDLLLQSTPEAAATFARKHQQAARAVAGGRAYRELARSVDRSAREYRDVCAAIDAIGHLGPRGQDALVARGERISAQLLAAAVLGRKRRVAYVDAVEMVETDGEHGIGRAKAQGRRDRDRSGLHREGARRQRRHARARWIGSHRDGPGAIPWRTACRAVEGRAGHPDR